MKPHCITQACGITNTSPLQIAGTAVILKFKYYLMSNFQGNEECRQLSILIISYISFPDEEFYHSNTEPSCILIKQLRVQICN